MKTAVFSRRGRGFPSLLLAVVLLFAFPLPSAGEGESARTALEEKYRKLSAVIDGQLGGESTKADELIGESLSGFFDLDLFSSILLPEDWSGLGREERARFRRALAKAFTRDLRSFLKEIPGQRAPKIIFESEEAVDERSVGISTPSYLRKGRNSTWSGRDGAREERVAYRALRYGFDGPRGKQGITFTLGRYADGSWKVLNVERDGRNLLRKYRRTTAGILQKYSLPYLVAELGGEDSVLIEDWQSKGKGDLPKGWSWKKKDDEKKKPYRVSREDEKTFLAADDRGESVVLGKDMRWNLNKYPYLSFQWRGHVLPRGSDERNPKSNDSVAAVSVLFKLKLGVIPLSIKYLWSESLPLGAALRQEGIGRPWMIVAESGGEHLGEWRTYVFNVAEAYRKTHGGEPPEVTVAIGLLTDANATGSRAAADYGEIRALRKADADSGILTFIDTPSTTLR